jgi:hypothetical protein
MNRPRRHSTPAATLAALAFGSALGALLVVAVPGYAAPQPRQAVQAQQAPAQPQASAPDVKRAVRVVYVGPIRRAEP